MSKGSRRRIRKQRRKGKQVKPAKHGAAGRHMLQSGRTGRVHSKKLRTLLEKAKKMRERMLKKRAARAARKAARRG